MGNGTLPLFAPTARSLFLTLALAATTSPALATGVEDSAWDGFLAEADIKAVYAAYDLAVELSGGPDGPVQDVCRKHAAGVATAVEVAPLSATVLNAAYRCAEALGDDDAAERYAMRFAAVGRHALSREHRDWSSRPIRVVGSSDIYVMLRASGLELRYEWLDYHAQPRHLVTHVVMWDAAAKRERHFAFDYLDVVMSLNRDDAVSAYPSARRNYARSIVRDLSNNGAVMGADMLAVLEARQMDDAKEKAARLRPAAEIGGLVSSQHWLELCHAKPFDGCGEGVVDALLPQVEKGYGLPTVMLALAYAQGVGVAKDEGAAMKLLDRAGGIMGQSQATVAFAREYVVTDNEGFPSGLVSRLEALAAQDDPYAWTLLAARTMRGAKDGRMTQTQAAALRRHADAGVTAATRVLAADLLQANQPADAFPLLLKAAEAGDVESQLLLSEHYQDGEGVPKDSALAQRWRLQAAAGGSSEAMLSLGEQSSEDQAWVQAQEWFRSAAIFGSDWGAILLAYLYTEGHEGLDGDADRAVRILESMDTPASRRALAYVYTDVDGVPKDTSKAVALLRQDAERGDDESARDLGLGWLEGRFGKVDETEALRWLKKGLDAGDGEIVDAYATHLYYEATDTAARARAMALWRQNLPLSPDDGFGNNFAWALCTSSDEAVRNGVEGLAVAKSLGDVDSLPSGTLDTLASCYAATSDFDEAARLQAVAVARRQDVEKNEEDLAGMRERLALYRGGEAYIETEREE